MQIVWRALGICLLFDFVILAAQYFPHRTLGAYILGFDLAVFFGFIVMAKVHHR